MNVTASTGLAPVKPPTVPYEPMELSSVWGRPLQPIEPPKQEKKEHVAAGRDQRVIGTTWQADKKSLGWTINTSSRGQETKTTREILGMIDADTLREARVKGGTRPQIEANRDRIAALLGLRDEWKPPDEVYADEAWEICIVWRSEFGRVEIGTEEDGSVGYYVSRTLSEKNREEDFQEFSKEEIDRVMSWLDEEPEEI